MTPFFTLAPAFGLTGLFASRVFLPAFAAALLFRFGPSVEWLGGFGLLAMGVQGAPPTWFTADLTLMVLGVLALAELIAHKSSGARELLIQVDQYAKPVAAVLTYLGILSVREFVFIDELVGQTQGQGDLGSYALTVLLAGGTYVVARAHNSALATVMEADEDDDTGVLGLFSWVQDLWSVFGIFLLLLFPIVALVLIGMGIGVILLMARWAAAREEGTKVACGACAQPMYRSALACAACGTANPSPTTVDWLGASTLTPVEDVARHTMELVAKKRCRKCAARLLKRSPAQACPACGTEPFDEPDFVTAYDGAMRARLPSVLVTCLFLSVLPLIGLVIGVIYFRLALVAPFRRYVGRGQAFVLRLGVKVLFFFLVLLQLVPMVGAVAVPVMAVLSYAVYRRAFFGMVRHAPAPAPGVG